MLFRSYYAYIVKLSLDPTFKREEYNAKLVKLLQHIFSTGEKEISTKQFLEVYRIMLPAMNRVLAKQTPSKGFNSRCLSAFYDSLLDNYLSPKPSLSKYDWPQYFRPINKEDLPLTLLREDPSLKDDIINEFKKYKDRKSTRLNSSHIPLSRMPSSA